MQLKIMRHRVAVYSLVIISLLSGIYSFFINPAKILITNDGTVPWEARMRAVRERLPAGVREIGYISDSENVGSMVEEYLLTQYAVIPVVVRHGTDYEWIVGNFTDPKFQDTLDAQIPDSYSMDKLGAGIYLIHRSIP